MLDPTNKPFTVMLGGKQRKLYFDINTLSDFEKETGKNFLVLLAGLEQAAQLAQSNEDPLALLKQVSMTEFRALIWAALHTMSPDGKTVVREFTLEEVGSMLTVNTLMTLLPQIMAKSSENMPDSGEEDGADPALPTPPKEPVKEAEASLETLTPKNGGVPSGPSDEDALASLTRKSDS